MRNLHFIYKIFFNIIFLIKDLNYGLIKNYIEFDISFRPWVARICWALRGRDLRERGSLMISLGF